MIRLIPMPVVAAIACLMLAAPAPAQEGADKLEVQITGDLPSVTVETADGPVGIVREQDTEAVVDPDFAKTSRACPPFCIQPMQVHPKVRTIGELELLDFLSKGGKVIDGRTIEWHLEGTIPGAINIPYTEMASRLDELDCTRGDGGAWDCAEAEDVALFCNGPWCGQSPMAIHAMLREGYPPEKIMYYRGGMQLWHLLGLTVVPGNF